MDLGSANGARASTRPPGCGDKTALEHDRSAIKTRHRILITAGLLLGLLACPAPAVAKGPSPFQLVISGRDQDREIRILPQEFEREVSGASGYFYGVLDPVAAPTALPSASHQVDFYLYVREELTIHGWVARTVYQALIASVSCGSDSRITWPLIATLPSLMSKDRSFHLPHRVNG